VLGLLLTDVFCGQVLKNLVDRKRPPIEHSEVIVRSPLYGNRSFPSNHAANMFCLAFLITAFAPSWKWYAYGLAILVAYSRSYVGLHYPSDWLVGAIIGTLVAWLVLKSTRRVFI
jgi:undecaprenyl-diphosphatase